MKLTSLCLAALILASPTSLFAKDEPVARPSFDCNRARTTAELAICRVPALGAKDRAIASLYPRVLRATPQAKRRALAADQALFNRSREVCYTPEQDQDDCLAAMMDARVWQLNGWLRGGFR
jgi:uncharacterized protein